MNTFFSKLKDFVGFGDPQEYEEYEEETTPPPSYQNLYQQEHPAPEEAAPRRRRDRIGMEPGSTTVGNVIGMPGLASTLSEVVVIEPRSFEEMPEVIRALRERKAVVLNLTLMDPDQAQRSVDFVAGGTYAIDGYQERIGESIFLFTPNSVQVSTQSGVMPDMPSSQARPNRVATPPGTTAWPETGRVAQ